MPRIVQRNLPPSDSYPPVVLSDSAGDPWAVDAWSYAQILWRRKWTVLACLLLALGAAVARVYFAVPLYRASARLQIEPENKVLPYQSDPAVVNAEYIATQCEVLRSHDLARRVAVETGLAPAVEEASEAAKRLLGSLTVLPMPGTMVVKLSVDSVTPEEASKLANAVTSEYISYSYESKYKASSKTRDVLRAELDALKREVESSERKLVDYALNTNRVLLSDPNDNVVERRLRDLNAELLRVETELLANTYGDIRRRSADALPEDLKPAPLRDALGRRSDLREQLDTLLQQFGPKWPEVKKVQNELNAVEQKIIEEERRFAESARAEYELLQGHRSRLQQAIREQDALFQRLNKDSIRYSILKREVETDQQLYEALLQSYKEATISAGLKSVNVRVIDRAYPPRLPYSPNVPLHLAMGAAFGLALGIALAFTREALHRSVGTEQDVEHQLGIATLGVIPKMINAANDRQLAVTPQTELRQLAPSASYAAESYRDLRSRLHLSPQLQNVRVMLLTSAFQGEGKSTTCKNLGLCLANQGTSTLILELDLRNPSLGQKLGMKTTGLGLGDVITGRCALADAIRPTKVPNLSVAFAGSANRDPGDIISTGALHKVLSEAATRFEYVLVDAPPVLSVAETAVFANQVDGVVLVVRAGSTPTTAVIAASRRITDVGGRILGVVINGADRSSSSYGYYYPYGQGESEVGSPSNGAESRGRRSTA